MSSRRRRAERAREFNRRDFLKKSALASFGVTLLPSLLRASPFDRLRTPPSDRLRIAHIGLGGMGNQHMKWFAALPDVEIVALCDVDQDHLNGTLKALKGLHPDTKATTYSDFRRILDRNDIDAITCANSLIACWSSASRWSLRSSEMRICIAPHLRSAP